MGLAGPAMLVPKDPTIPPSAAAPSSPQGSQFAYLDPKNAFFERPKKCLQV